MSTSSAHTSILAPAVLAVAGCFAATGTANAGFTSLVTPIDISPATTGSWQVIDLSSLVPIGTTGAIVEIGNASATTDYTGVVRGGDDTRDYMLTPGEVFNPDYNTIYSLDHRTQIVKVDSTYSIQGFISDANVELKLVGYTTGNDPSYFIVPPDITPTTTGVWTTVDVSTQVGADADGVILFFQGLHPSNRNYGAREMTGSDSKLRLQEREGHMAMVGLDASKQFEA